MHIFQSYKFDFQGQCIDQMMSNPHQAIDSSRCCRRLTRRHTQPRTRSTPRYLCRLYYRPVWCIQLGMVCKTTHLAMSTTRQDSQCM